MDIKATLLPGQNGTKQLLAKYGDALVCVRYRYDKERYKRIKTVELIVDETDWIPSAHAQIPKPVWLRVGYEETALRERVKAAGGSWEPKRKLWRLAHPTAVKLKLMDRVVEE